MTAPANQPVCGQRAVLTQGRPAWSGGYLSGSCVEPKGHDGEHCAEDGQTWQESVR